MFLYDDIVYPTFQQMMQAVRMLLRYYISRRQGQELHLEQHEVIAPMPTRGGKSKGGRGAATSRNSH